jgi:excisionase family DNA binding protein
MPPTVNAGLRVFVGEGVVTRCPRGKRAQPRSTVSGRMNAVTREPRLLSAREVATTLGVSIDTVRRRASDGTLRPVRLGNRGWLRFDRADVEALIAGGRVRR